MVQEGKATIYCNNEHDPLRNVIVAPPKYMAITEVINETQSHYIEENINIERALEQYYYFVETLEIAGVQVEKLTPHQELNEQIFTRDIGFVIGEQLFVSSMNRDIRQKEVAILQDWLLSKNIPYETFNHSSIEGGDVMIDGEQIWVGLSDRTSLEAINELQQKLPKHIVTPIPLRKDILHLDCAFNIFDDRTALLYPGAVNQDIEKILRGKYQIFEVTAEEQFFMGPNILAIGKKKLISLPENKRINKELTNAGYTVIEVPFSEIIKSGGSYRCCSLPLLRK